jgi:hypothetical protein
MAVFWVVAPCTLVWAYQRFRGLYCLRDQGDGWQALIALVVEAVQTSETLIHSYQSTRRYIPEDSHLQIILIHHSSSSNQNVSTIAISTKKHVNNGQYIFRWCAARATSRTLQWLGRVLFPHTIYIKLHLSLEGIWRSYFLKAQADAHTPLLHKQKYRETPRPLRRETRRNVA